MYKTTVCFIACLSLLSTVKSAKILAIFPAPGYSQFILGERLICELAERGHDVTIIGPYRPKDCADRCRTILTDGLLATVKDLDLFNIHGLSCFGAILNIHELGFLLTEYTLAHEQVQNLLKSDETFDLVIAEKFANEAFMAFSKHFHAPLILFSSNGPSEWTHASVGNINLPSVAPSSHAGFTTTMDFYQRFLSTIYSIFDTVYWHSVVLPKQKEYVEKYFPGNIDLSDVLYNVSLVLLNSHVSTTEPFSTVPNMIEIGGFHIKPKQLPPDLKKWLDEATEGAIIFSMGSNLNSKNFPQEKMKAMLNVFSKLKQRVLWKFETDLENKPNNVFIAKWLPQSDILGHPNVRLLISHGGLLSTTEAVYYGVPVIGIPIFGDQPMNVARLVKHGFGVHLSFNGINEASFENAIREILNNSRYKHEAKKRSTILKDQMVSPIEQAMFWIEYVIRHQGAPHLKAASVDLYWYQLYLLDVAAVALSIMLGLFLITKYVCRLLCSSKVNKCESKHCDKKKRQ